MLNRRQFVRSSLAAAAGLRLTRPLWGADPVAHAGLTGFHDAGGRPRALISKVVRVTSERVIPVRVVQPTLLRDALREGLMRLTGASSSSEAWHRILHPDDTVLIKFSRSAADMIGTTVPVARQVVDSLLAAGWSPERIMLLEAGPLHEAGTFETRPADLRWQGRQVTFPTCGADSFIAALAEATAVINVPFLKTHHMATITGCMKNLSHGLIRHPGRFHGGGCDPAIAEITASEPIRSKLRVNIVNALRVVFRNGPEAAEDDIENFGGLLVGTDPVACDAVGYGILNEIRALRELPPLLKGAKLPPCLVTGGRIGLGQPDLERIQIETAVV